jgi:ribosomal protein S14
MSNTKRAQRLGNVGLSEILPVNAVNWAHSTTNPIPIQSTKRPACTRCGRSASIIYVDDNGKAFDLCRRCHPEAIGNSPGARARQAFANLFKEVA